MDHGQLSMASEIDGVSEPRPNAVAGVLLRECIIMLFCLVSSWSCVSQLVVMLPTPTAFNALLGHHHQVQNLQGSPAR